MGLSLAHFPKLDPSRASRIKQNAENCISTLRMRGHDDWLVVQHQQTPPLTASVEA
jgi:hypothetical protein